MSSATIRKANRAERQQRIEAEAARVDRELRERMQPVYQCDALAEVATVQTHSPALAPIPPEREFVSAPEAVEIPKYEIQNFTALRPRDSRALLREIAERLGMDVGESEPDKFDDQWGDGWKDGDQRWTLTPHELRKLREKKYK